MTRTAVTLVLLLAVGGCATPRATLRELPEADLTSAETVAELLSAIDLLVPLVVFAAASKEFRDEACPARIDLGETSIFVGGCTDSEGNTWSGTKRVRLEPGRLRARYREFPFEYSGGVMRGRVRAWEDGDWTHFEIELRLYGDSRAERNVFVYAGRTSQRWLTDELWSDGRAAWTGAGTIALEGLGKVEVHSYGGFDTSVCKREPLYGRTRMRAGGHTVEVVYDGAVDCVVEGPGRAPWTLDGEAMGELEVTVQGCSTTDEPRTWGWLLLLVAAAIGRGQLSRSRSPRRRARFRRRRGPA